MTIIANLDAAIDQHYAETGDISKELQIFQKVWTLEPTLTTAQLDPLMKVQAAAEIANDRSRAGSQEETLAAIGMLAALPDILTMIIIEEQRQEFSRTIRSRGVPLAVAPKILEAIFVAYDAAPFTSEEPSSSESQLRTDTPLPASTSGSGNSLVSAGPRLSQPSNPSPIDTPPQPTAPQAAPTAPVQQQQGTGLQAVPSPEEALQPYQTQIPHTVQ